MLHRYASPVAQAVLLAAVAAALALGASPAAAQFTPTVDGTIPNGANQGDEYVTAAPRADNVGNGIAPEAERILFYADDANQTLYVGVRGALPTGNDDGIALWLNFRELDGADAGTDLGVSGAGHYMSSNPEADFEVDYMLALHTNSSSSEVQVEAVKHVGTTASQNLGTSDQSGTSTTNINSDFFSAGSVTFAFNNTGEKDDDGFEIAIPYGELGITRAGAMEAFAGTVSPSGSFTDETVPGDLGGVDAGTNPDFGALSGGPFHRTKTFTSRFTLFGFGDGSDGSFTSNNTWEATETDGETIPFEGSKVELGSVQGGNRSAVSFDQDVTLHTLRVNTGTDNNSNDSNVSSTVTVVDSLILETETLADDGGTLELQDGITIRRSNGKIEAFYEPTFLGNASVIYTAGLNTGPEIPSTASKLQLLRIDASGNTVTLTNSVTVNRALELEAGTLSGQSSFLVTLADGSTLRVGTGSTDFTPTVADGTAATVVYTTGGVTTGPELPAGAAGDVTLRVDAGGTVTLESNASPSLDGDLTIPNGTLDDNGNSITVHGNATIDGTHTSTSGGQLTFSGGSSTHTLAGSGTYGTVELNESSTFSGAEATISEGATFGDLTATTGVLEVQSSGATVTGTATVDSEAQLRGPLDIGTGATVNGTLALQSGGDVTGAAPNYGNSATLRYATGSNTGRSLEWSSTSGAGYPTDVTLANSTTLDLSAGGAGTARALGGALNVNSGSTLDMDDMSAALTVGNGATVNGTLTLGSAAGGNLTVSGGDLTVDGTLTANGRTVALNGSSAQTLGGSTSPLSLGGLTVDNGNGVTLTTGVDLSKTLTLTSGTLSRSASQSLTMQDGTTLQLGTGDTDFSRTYEGAISVTYTAGTTTGNELTSTPLNTVEVNASGNTVIVATSTNPTLNEDLTVTNGTLDLQGNDVTLKGDLTTSGSLSAGSSALTFSGSGTQTISGGPTLNDVTASATIDPGSGTTISGTLILTSGGSLTNNAPTYGGGATLRYETGTTTDRGLEWSSTSGDGYPTDVTLANGTTLDLSAGGAGTARSMAGALTIGGGSTLDMADMSAALTVGNGATVNGTLTLGSATGGNLTVSGGDLTVDGTLTANGRTVALNGSSAQTLGGSTSPLSLGGLTVDNGNGVTLTTGVDLSKTLTLTGGTLTTNGNLTLQSTASRTAAVAGSGSGTVSGDVTMERHVGITDDNTNNSHWRFLSAPLAVKLDDAGAAGNSANLLSNVWTQSTGSGANTQVSAGNATVFTYDETTDISSSLGEGWTDVADLNGSSISPGDGHLVFLFENNNEAGPDGFPVTLSVTGPLPANETDGSDAAPALTFTDDNDTDAQNGWNLVANPFAAPLDWESVVDHGLEQLDKTIYVWDPENGQYASYTADGGGTGGSGTQDRYIAPFQVFFVKAEPLSIKPPDPPDKSSSFAPGMTITSADKDVSAGPSLKNTPSDSAQSPRITLRLRNDADSTAETTTVHYTDEAYKGKDRLDAYQLKPFRSTYALLASGMQGRDALFDLQSRPVPTVRDTLDLALDITKSGTYTLDAAALQGVPAGWKVILENEGTGARHDLGAGGAVTFDYTAPASKTASGRASAAPLQDGVPTVATADDSTDALPSYRLYVGPQAALPVELASFDAAVDDHTVALTWQTASETNNAGFTVERRIEGAGSWIEVGTREGAGTTTQPQTYRFRDTEVPFAAETLTYRLRQADLDGRTTLSDTLAVSLATPETTTLRPPFPNPVRQQATIRYTLPRAQDVTIALYDVLGRRVRTLSQGQQAAGRHERSVDLSALPSGTYFVRMRADNATHTRRLTVVR